jgi:hypothetical protein
VYVCVFVCVFACVYVCVCVCVSLCVCGLTLGSSAEQDGAENVSAAAVITSSAVTKRLETPI